MNRREAVAALVALPEVGRIMVTTLKPSDVIVVETTNYMSDAGAMRIKEVLQQVWPGHKIVVVDKGLTLKVVKGQS